MLAASTHHEHHFTGSAMVRDLVIGMSDGLTVPFALAAGLSGAAVSTHIVVTAGLAEIAAGSIAMGLGGYLAARGDAEHYAQELAREEREIIERPDDERQEVAEVFMQYGMTESESVPLVEALAQRPEAWRDFMMRFELGLEAPEPGRALASAGTIAAAYIAGGLIPLGPYFAPVAVHTALLASIAVTGAALVVFGYVKGKFTGAAPVRSAVQTALIGGVAAAAAFLIARAIS
ncbi:MAG TPA: VIT1/CCC1 transporter family protein [Terriglobales bacterium]|nr:VIT1/CCC1 transporter family protein [Terriglobales bacterium]